jgi:hypothetical protein
MATFYTVSVIPLVANVSLTLNYKDYNPLTELSKQGWFERDETEKILYELYPEGLSIHGKQYAIKSYTVTNGGNDLKIQYSRAIELQLELVRRLRFPDKPSRFISMFGSETLEDALRYKSKHRYADSLIYEVNTDSYFRADMNWLSGCTSLIGGEVAASKYWQGLPTADPIWEILLQFPVNVIRQIL